MTSSTSLERRTRKSPQEKKALEYARDHFTFGFDSSRNFPETWKRKKAHVNRQYRRKAQELLAEAKPGISGTDLVSDDLTAARFQKSVSRKRLYKQGTVTLGEKIKIVVENRGERAGRKAARRQIADGWALSAITTLNRLQGEELMETARRAEALCSGKSKEIHRLTSSPDPVDRALEFLRLLHLGSQYEVDALRRRPDLQRRLSNWLRRSEKSLTKTRHKQENVERNLRAAKRRD